jgi:hypothetical protein
MSVPRECTTRAGKERKRGCESGKDCDLDT